MLGFRASFQKLRPLSLDPVRLRVRLVRGSWSLLKSQCRQRRQARQCSKAGKCSPEHQIVTSLGLALQVPAHARLGVGLGLRRGDSEGGVRAGAGAGRAA